MPNPPSLDNVDIQSLANGQVEQGWKILGESSEWVLKMLDAHDPKKQVPPQNVAQFLHYLGNQLLVEIGSNFNAMKDGLYAPDWGEEEPSSISRMDVE